MTSKTRTRSWSARRPLTAVAIALTAAAAVAACGAPAAHRAATYRMPGTSGAAPATGVSASLALSAGPSPRTTTAYHAVDKILVIVEENHTATSAYASMPYLAHLGKYYGRVDGYRAITHPSLPNYLALSGGTTYGVTDDLGPSAHPIRGHSVFGQAIATHHTAKVYAEGMIGNCSTTGTSRYAVRHTGWPYFVDERTWCKRYDVPLGSATSGPLATDIRYGHLPNVSWLIPDVCNDAHDCSLATADAWLHAWMTRITSGPDYASGRLAVVVTFDEGVGTSQQVAFVVVNPRTHPRVVSGSYNHYSLVRMVDSIVGVPALHLANTAPNLRLALHL